MRLLRVDEDGEALLLERIQPGDPLDLGSTPGGLDGLAELLNALHASPVSARMTRLLPPLAAVAELLIATAGQEAAARSPVEAEELQPRLERARERVTALLSSGSDAPVLLHGDLENKNILRCAKRGLVAIDPLPCIGEPAYDAGY